MNVNYVHQVNFHPGWHCTRDLMLIYHLLLGVSPALIDKILEIHPKAGMQSCDAFQTYD